MDFFTKIYHVIVVKEVTAMTFITKNNPMHMTNYTNKEDTIDIIILYIIKTRKFRSS